VTLLEELGTKLGYPYTSAIRGCPYPLRELRVQHRGRRTGGQNPEDLAILVEQTQGQVSETERRSDHRLSTLRRYVEALGGEIEVVASFGDKRIRLRSV
jgi:hypothetical protein